MTSRRAARRTALELLYQWDLTGQPLASLHEGEVDPFARALAEEVREHATDLDRSWEFGTGGPTVSGVGSALAWWTTGRGIGDGLISDDGRVPRMEPW